MRVKFDWDDGNLAHAGKHGLSIAEMEAVLVGPPPPLIAPDVDHSMAGEQRLIAIGRQNPRKPVFVVFTLREREGQTFVRIISARRMREKEYRRYAEAHPPPRD